MDPLTKEYLGVKEWYAPSDIADTKVDIVAVHGLGAHPYWTWTASREDDKATQSGWHKLRITNQTQSSYQTKVFWLQELLPRVIPNARILTFGYLSNFWRNAPRRDISNISQELLNGLIDVREDYNASGRPIIFVCHCFGGIVVKEALVKSTLAAKRYGSVRSATQGLIFLGTPHRGASIASYGDMLVSITKVAGLGSQSRLIHSIRERSSELLKLSSYFSDIYDSLDIFCFYELLPSKFGATIVSQESAVIDGHPSEGMTTDHSGLNKFANDQDHSFCQVVREIKRMAKPSANKNRADLNSDRGSPERGAHIELKPWEISSRLVGSIQESWAQAISSTDSEERAHAMDIENCKFRSWAYTVGLLEIHQSARLLHELFTTATGTQVCDYLQQLEHAVVRLRGGTREESPCKIGRGGEGPNDHIHELLDKLYSLLPEEDKEASEKIFSATLALSNDEGVLTNLVLTPNLQEFPDVTLIAAMRRIKLLQERAESFRLEDEKLSVHLNALHLVNPKSSRSTGSYTPNQLNGGRRQILIEWKKYQGYWDTEIGNELFQRTEALTRFLQQASKGAEILNLRILHCLGYYHDERHKRLGLVFTLPPSTVDMRSYSTLNKYIMRNINQPALLGDRFKLAQILCRAMFEFHRAKWFHKSFSSYNILMFAETDLSGEDEDNSKRQSPEYSLLAPYIVGFNYSRQDRPNEFSEPVDLTLPMLRYHHWEYKGVAMKKYKRAYDYYSLGMVLLEIGLWCPLEELMRTSTDLSRLDAASFAAKIREKYCMKLGSYMGSTYRNVVLDLLNAVDWTEDQSHTNGEDSEGVEDEIGQMLEFRLRVVEPLNHCCA